MSCVDLENLLRRRDSDQEVLNLLCIYLLVSNKNVLNVKL